MSNFHCHGCGEALVLDPRDPVGRRAACEHCDRDLHVCLNCRHHDPSAHNECREPVAEYVKERDRSNFCDYFSFREGSAKAGNGGSEDARKALDSLFKF